MLKEMMNKKLNDYTGKETLVYAGIFVSATMLMSGVIYLGVMGYEKYETYKEKKEKEKENN
jgi:heme/copper-type cytochrome/quinol oxidase subunit 1